MQWPTDKASQPTIEATSIEAEYDKAIPGTTL
jgi:hypothetical protein